MATLNEQKKRKEELAKIRQERDEEIAKINKVHKKEVILLFSIIAIEWASIVYFAWFC